MPRDVLAVELDQLELRAVAHRISLLLLPPPLVRPRVPHRLEERVLGERRVVVQVRADAVAVAL